MLRRTFFKLIPATAIPKPHKPVIKEPVMQGPNGVLNTVTYPPGALQTDPRIVIDGTRGAIFEYGANGVLSAVWASAPGTDPYGNTYVEGLTIQDSESIVVSQINFPNNAFISGQSGDLTIGNTLPGSALQLLIPLLGTLTITDPNNPSVPESWHPMTLQNGWTVGTSGYARFMLLADGMVKVQARNLVPPASLVNGSVIWNPITGYIPAVSQPITELIMNTTGSALGDTPRMDVSAANQMQVFNVPSGTTDFGFNGDYSLT